MRWREGEEVEELLLWWVMCVSGTSILRCAARVQHVLHSFDLACFLACCVTSLLIGGIVLLVSSLSVVVCLLEEHFILSPTVMMIIGSSGHR